MRKGMNLHSVVPILVFLATACHVLALEITNTSGKVFQNVEIKEVRPDGLTVFHSTGIGFIPFGELPETVQKEYGYDPQKENEFLRRQAEADAKRQVQQRESETIQLIKKSGLKANLKIIQITDEGVLATGYYTKEEEYEDTEYQTVKKVVGLDAPGRPGTIEQQVAVKTGKKKRSVRHDLPDRIFVICIPSNLVDNDWFTTMIYPCGRHQYVTVLGAKATIERYATSPMVVKKLLGL
jgi:hypothetical protein